MTMAAHTPIRKVLISSFGDASVVSVVDSTIAPPAVGEVQVSPLYSGFNGADVNMRRGTYPLQKSAPLTPGYCLVGRVVSSGQNTQTKLQPGNIVACLTVYDAQATLVNVPEKYLVAVPPGLDPAVATALVLDWNTAYAMVYRTAQVSQGQRVFIHGLSGAVGNALLHLCRLRGAEVYGTASSRNHDLLRQQGATPFVYTDKAWITAMKAKGGAHAVFDALGFESWDESWSILSDAEPSILVGYGGNQRALEGGEGKGTSTLAVLGRTLKLLARGAQVWTKKRTSFYYISRDHATFEPDLRTLFQMAKDGEIDVNIKKIWDMEDIQEAHRGWGSGEGVGSLLIKVAGTDL